MRKMLTYDYAKLTRTEMCTLDNNVTSCFDRQLPSLLSLICGKFGMPSEICGMYTNILHDMKYHIKTINGISDEFYSNAFNGDVYGIGQGNGASSPIWLCTSIALMNSLCDHHTGMKFVAPDGTRTTVGQSSLCHMTLPTTFLFGGLLLVSIKQQPLTARKLG